MIVSYDNLAGAVYIQIQTEAKVSKTIEFEPETFLDLDSRGHLIGIEMLNPGQLILKRIAKKYNQPEFAQVRVQKLQDSIAA